MPTYTCTCILIDGLDNNEILPFLSILYRKLSEFQNVTEEIVTLSGLLKTVLKTLPAHNKTTYMQIHVLFVYMIIYMYSYFLFL